ncbi:hypothetical protein P3875_09735 [Myroides sp. JBRI-B21084]|uniref:hypothetical protein n=1 Tax=Myroides sp. JBRI-B21084 TaxID=3119977 RepID=UPI0026E30977|nr:hypothetical protein [Paenimyroides cloacae]WKW46057.1 hypothetical protein P3875_09735 [Paenimyroides cloacae]
MSFKITLFATAVLLFCNKLVAQNQVTLNVNLYPIQTLVINPSQKEVNLNYSTLNDYENGVVSLQKDHLTIYSTGGFQVKVNALASSTNQSALKNISIEPTLGSNPLQNGTVIYSEKIISETEQPIISATKGAINKNVSISYKGAGNDVFFNNTTANNSSTHFTYTLLYTIIAQ